MATFQFLTPPGPLAREGGGAFIHALTRAMQDAGHSIGRDASVPGIRVIDGAALAGLPVAEMQGAVGLIHHTTPLVAPDAKPEAAAAEQARLPLLRRVVTTSGAVAERVAALGVPGERITVVHPGVPDALRSTGSGGPECNILAVGALVPRKGHAVLLRALARLFDLDWRLVIAGDDRRDPATTTALHDLAQEPALRGRVLFAGALDDAALEQAWRSADLFALATEWEGYGAPVAEALRRGLPVAVTAGGAAAELVGPETGVVVHPGDADGLSKAMRRVVFDTALRADMAEAAWQVGRSLPTWSAQAALFVEACAS